jgi:hypothetical protein
MYMSMRWLYDWENWGWDLFSWLVLFGQGKHGNGIGGALVLINAA